VFTLQGEDRECDELTSLQNNPASQSFNEKSRMRRRLFTGVLPVCLGLILCACGRHTEAPPAPPKPVLKTAPATPIAETKQELGQPSWDPAWDRIVEEALSPAMLSPAAARGVRTYCPRFASMNEADKRAFWAYTFQALAGAEAGLTPTTDVRHTEPEVAKVDTVTKRMVRSEGLLQLTYMDATRYGCDFDWNRDKSLPEKDPAKTILQPKNNLLCGVKILENQMITQHRPLLSPASYWVTLQPSRPSYRVFAKQMKNVPAACRQAAPSREKAGNQHSRSKADAAVTKADSAHP
jgi:hypothetical protein